MARFHLINGVKVPYTAEEEIARDKEEAAYALIRAANEYSWKRAEAYPSIQEQLDLLWHAIDDDADLKTKLSGFYNAIKAVKDSNPKPS
tara:strand:- start:296 stop:562 length:267 start_codon:yes stop_codon:yes gene_type:complete